MASLKIITKVKVKLANSKKDKLREKAKEVEDKHHYLNCRLFAQLLTDITKIENQPKTKTVETGSILWWGTDKQKTQAEINRHCAVALDKNTVLQVPEWGGKLEELPLKKVEEYWGKPDRIYKGK
jgi:hypothetical protein